MPTTPRKWGAAGREKRPLYRSLFFQIIAAFVLGILAGAIWPAFGSALKPLGDAFIDLVKMIIAPLVFCVVVTGIAGAKDMASLRRIGVKTLVYFNVLTLVALTLGVLAANWTNPGQGMNIDPDSMDSSEVEATSADAEGLSTVGFIMDIIPSSVVSAFAENQLLQVLLVSILFGIALAQTGNAGQGVVRGIEKIQNIIFRIIGYIMLLAPLATFGAMAYAVGEYGVGTLGTFGKLIGTYFATVAVFLGVVAIVARMLAGVRFWKVLKYFSEEIALSFGTGSSEAVMPQVMAKLEKAGCSRSVVGLVVPTGYSFNLDGAAIYLSLSVVFLAQAVGVDLTLGDQIVIVAVAMLTSNGMAGVAGSALVALTATVGAVDAGIPLAAIALILGPDRIMGKARTFANLVGNIIAAFVIARWDNQLDDERMRAALEGGPRRKEEESFRTSEAPPAEKPSNETT